MYKLFSSQNLVSELLDVEGVIVKNPYLVKRFFLTFKVDWHKVCKKIKLNINLKNIAFKFFFKKSKFFLKSRKFSLN